MQEQELEAAFSRLENLPYSKSKEVNSKQGAENLSSKLSKDYIHDNSSK